MGPLTESGKVEKLQKVGRGLVTVIEPSGFVSFIYLEGEKKTSYTFRQGVVLLTGARHPTN